MYYPSDARVMALGNDHVFHLTAWAKNGKSYIYGVNSNRCSTKFGRRYTDGVMGYHLHAEMDLLRKIRGTGITEISVARFTKRGLPTMAKPCRFCQHFLRAGGIKRVNYTNWDGIWESMKL